MQREKQRTLFSWFAMGLLALLFCLLAYLQYRWTGELSLAEKGRLQASLQAGLQRLSVDFNNELNREIAALLPPNGDVADMGQEAAYTARANRWLETSQHSQLFRRVAVAVPVKNEIKLLVYAPQASAFEATSQWPENWKGLQEWMQERTTDSRRRTFFTSDTSVIEIPRFDPPRPEGFVQREREWLIVELNLPYLSNRVIPELTARHLGRADIYDVEIVVRSNPADLVFRSATDTADRIQQAKADASVPLLEVRRFGFLNRGRGGLGGPPPDARFAREGRFERPIEPPPGRTGEPREPEGRGGEGPGPGAGPPPPSYGRWLLLAQHRAGSLDALVVRTRWRNLSISAGILGLMIAAMVALLRFSRQAQRLADLQIEFVAGVSHELRTPLTVIRTAAHNLRGKIASNPAQVERYGTLILGESEKLSAIVEQVLRFAGAKAGRVIREREPLSVGSLVETTLNSVRGAAENARCEIESRIEPGLPIVLGDSLALQHAIQNLIANAIKYGTEQERWVGIEAAHVTGDHASGMIEIRVSDHGPGIPSDEMGKVFEPFFRGERAVRDQIHGTGLGLNLVKRIVEAHEGVIWVESKPNQGTTFIMQIPIAPRQYQDEFANTAG